MKKNLLWQVGYSSSANKLPEEFVRATVPGAVQLDWAQAKNYPDPLVDINFKQYKWMEDQYWYYKTTLEQPLLTEGQSAYFVSKGIDYEFDISIDGKRIFSQEGMFTEVELDITQYIGKSRELLVCIHPIPKDLSGIPDCREEARQSVKPAAAYEWDWHPRLVPLGIWEETYIEIREESYIHNTEVKSVLDKTLSHAKIYLNAEIVGNEAITWRVFAPDGELIFEEQGKQKVIELEKPQLWWCNGYGTPALYSWEAELLNGDKKSGKFGIRKVELTMNEGTWNEPASFPKTRSNPPITLTLNGVNIFAKGSNWVCPEIFPGVVDKETYEPLVKYAKEANMNIFRCWGGAYVDKEYFFDLCDEMGIMVWQEFPLACNDYYDSEHYLTVLEQEAISILKRLRKHACIVLWCGGNELFNNWSGMHEQKLALRLLNKLCYDYDRNTPFIMTSPLMGMAHGNYLFQYQNGEEVFYAMQHSHNTAYTEFGVPSIAEKSYLEQYISKEYLEPFKPNDVTIAHHAFSAWYPGDDTWCCKDVIENYFGKQKDLEGLIEKSQWMQSEGYKSIFEEARRQKPYCSMALNWCFNEPWPTIANNSIFSYPANPKPAYYGIKESLKSVTASARIPKFSYCGNELFEAELWMLNDSLEKIPAGTMKVYLKIGSQTKELLTWDYEASKPGVNKIGPSVRCILPNLCAESMELILEAGDMSNEYRLLYKEDKKKETEGLKITNV